jgi:hypothetical protein
MASEYDLPSIWYDEAGVLYDGAVQQFDGVIFSVQMAFGDAPLSTSPTWTDVTTFVRGFSINRGRNSEFTTYGPGTVSIALDNRDRRFDPEYTSGPYFGDLNPMVPVRVQTTYSGSTYTMFYGFVQGWPTIYNQSNTDAVASVTAIDATRLLGNIPLAEAGFVREVLDDEPYAYWTFDQPTRNSHRDRIRNIELSYDLNLSPTAGVPFYSDAPYGSEASLIPGPFQLTTPQAINPYPGFQTIELWVDIGAFATFDGLFYEDDDEYFNVLVNTNTKQITAAVYSQINNRYRASYTVSFSSVYRAGGNHVVVSYDVGTSTIVIYANGTSVDSRSMTVGTVSGPLFLPFPITVIDGPCSHLATYNKALSSTRVTAHYNAGVASSGTTLTGDRVEAALFDAGWPTAFQSLEQGDVTVGVYRQLPSSTLDYLQKLDAAEQGALFVNREGEVEFRSRTTAEAVSPVGLFDDAGTDLPFANVSVDSHTVDAIRNVVQGSFRSRFNDETLSASDASSIAAYGEALESLNLTVFDDRAAAQAVLDARLARAKDPRTRITRLDINVRRDPAGLVPVVAALDLSDDVTVSLTPTGVGDPLWRAVRVQGITHTVTPQSWDVSMYLAPGPINTNGPLMILDDDTYGVLDSNKLG